MRISFRRITKYASVLTGPIIGLLSGEHGKTFAKTLKVIEFHILWRASRLVDLMTAEDATQNALVSFIEKRRQDPKFIDGQALTLPLLYTVAERAVAKIWREQKRANEISIDDEDVHLNIMLSARRPDHDNATSELLARIKAAVFAMPIERRTVFLMRHDKGSSYEDIAKELDITVGTARNHNSLALKELREALKDYDGVVKFLVPEPRGRHAKQLKKKAA